MSILDLQAMSFRNGNSEGGGRSMGGGGLSTKSVQNCNVNSNFSVSLVLCEINGGW